MACSESEGALKTFILPLLLLTVGPCAVHGDDSIVISSGNGSIVISGRKPAEAKNPVSVPVPEEKPVEKTSSAANRPQQHVVPSPAVVEVPSRRYLAMFTASYCGPCQTWKATVYPQLRAAGYHVHFVEMTDPNNAATYGAQIGSYPTFVACDWNTGQWVSDKKIGAIDLNTAKWMLDSSVGLSGQKAVTKSSTVAASVNVSPPSRYIQQEAAGRYVLYGGTTYDMETWTRMCSLRNCGMCQYLDSMQAQYRANKAAMNSPQSSSSPDVVDEAIDIMQLTSSDVVAELGCGDGKAAIQMAKRSGCRVEGYEIDPQKVAEARRNVADAGLSDRITIHENDIVGLKLPDSTTAIYAFLYPELLAKIKPQLMTGRIAVCPGHSVDGIGMQLIGQCWVRKSI